MLFVTVLVRVVAASVAFQAIQEQLLRVAG
jgi:hypothetical protein